MSRARPLFVACRVLLIVVATACAGARGADTLLVHNKVVDLKPAFAAGKPDGVRALSMTCDGSNVYVGGMAGKTEQTVGIVKVAAVARAEAEIVPIPATRFSAPAGRGFTDLAFDREGRALVAAHDSGEPATSFIRRIDPADGSAVWNATNFETERPAAVAIDPKGDNAHPAVAFVVTGDAKLKWRSLGSGEAVNNIKGTGYIGRTRQPGEKGPITWQSISFDPDANILTSTYQAISYGKHDTSPRVLAVWYKFGGKARGASTVITKEGGKGGLRGCGAVIMPGVGGPGGDAAHSDMIAFSVQDGDVKQTVSFKGEKTPVTNTRVQIRKLDGSAEGVAVKELNGDEDGVGKPWTGVGKSLWFGAVDRGDAAGGAGGAKALIVLDSKDARLDVYLVK